MKNYYILTSKRSKKILPTQSFTEAFEFMAKNPDVRIRTIDYTAKPKILNRVIFFRDFIKNTGDVDDLFTLIQVMIKNTNNKNDLIQMLDLKEEYNVWKKIDKENI